MTARAPFLGSTIRWALGLTLLQVNTTTASDEARADLSCRVSRYSVRSTTIALSPPSPAADVYSENLEFSFKL
jgi:hypothetical protein